MKAKSAQAQTIIDEGDVGLMEGHLELRGDLAAIEQAEVENGRREIRIQQATSYLDGRDYDLVRITAEINAQLGHITHAYIEVGKKLLAVKTVEGHGNFLQWLSNNFGLSSRSAQHFMLVATKLEQRPELKPLANGGIGKALILLDMPEELTEEFIENGTIDGQPPDELFTMSNVELRKRIKSLEKEKTRIVTEETKALKRENDDLQQEIHRLKKFEPAEQITPERYQELLKDMNSALLKFCNLAHQLTFDEGLKDDFGTQATVEAMFNRMRKELSGSILEFSRNTMAEEHE